MIQNATVAANSGGLQATDGHNLGGCVKFGVGYVVTFHANATKGARINFFGDYGNTGAGFSVTQYDEPYDSIDIKCSPGHSVGGIAPIDSSPVYVKAQVLNLDPAQSLTGCYVLSIIQTQ
jgi:hypothetical protein